MAAPEMQKLGFTVFKPLEILVDPGAHTVEEAWPMRFEEEEVPISTLRRRFPLDRLSG